MAAVTAAALGISAGLSIYKAVEGKKQAKKAKAEINDYERQQLTNVYAGVELPMEASRRAEEALNVTTQSQIEAASEAGARGLGVALPRIQDFQSRSMTQIGLGLQESKFRLDQLIAGDEANIRGLQERREEGDLAGLGAQYEAGRQDFYGGLGDVAETIGSIGSTFNAPKTEAELADRANRKSDRIARREERRNNRG